MSMARQIKRQAQGVKSFDRMTPEERTRAMCKFGITPKQLQDSYDTGYKDGSRDTITKAQEFTFKVVYAAFQIEMIDNRRMDMDEAVEILRGIDHQVVSCIDDNELVDEAYQRTGVSLNWADPVERVV